MFKAGDVVLCVDRGLPGNQITPGKSYVVLSAHTMPDTGGQVPAVTVCNDAGVDTPYYARRFKLAEPVKIPTPLKYTLPTDSQERKGYPVHSGCLKYFPAAIAGVSRISKMGNDKHNPGQELHHARGKSMDHSDCIIRHLMDVEDLIAAHKRGDANVKPQDVLTEVSSMAWRALAFSQELHEQFGAPLAPGAKK